MKIEELKNEEMYCLFASDGSSQLATLAPTFPMCVAMIKMLHKTGLSQSFHELVNVKGWEILPVYVSIRANGTAEQGFERAKAQL